MTGTMRSGLRYLLCGLGFGLLASVPAAAQAELSQVVTFGDSLTHNDLLGFANGVPQDLFGADPMEAVFDQGARAGDRLDNYAIAGSEAAHVQVQIDLYQQFVRFGLQAPATLFHYEVGGNDLLNNVDLLAAHAPGADPAADAVIDGILANMTRDLQELAAGAPAAQFVVWTVPDVTMSPEHWGRFSPAQEANLRAHAERANRRIRRAERDPRVFVFDFYAEGRAMVLDPQVLFGRTINPPPQYGDYDDMFGDSIHPTAVSNASLANAMIAGINAKWNDTIAPYSDEELADLAHIPH